MQEIHPGLVKELSECGLHRLRIGLGSPGNKDLKPGSRLLGGEMNNHDGDIVRTAA
jgi:hypothetical protein